MRQSFPIHATPALSALAASTSTPAWFGPRRAPRARQPVSNDLENLAQLLVATASGDDLAFKRLYACSSPALYARVRRIVWQHCEAEEVLQQIYLQIWHNAARFDPRLATAMTWMARIARNGAIDHLRRRTTRRGFEDLACADFDEDADDPTGIDQLVEPGPGPEQLLQQRQTTLWFDDLLGRIPAAQRRVIVLAARDGRSMSEIAELCGAPLGSVKSWMRRGLQAMKLLMEAEAKVPPTFT